MMVLSVVGAGMLIMCFLGTRERVVVAPGAGRPSAARDFAALIRNDQLMVVCAAQIVLLVGIAGRGASTVYFANHSLGLRDQAVFVTAFVTTGMVGNIVGGVSSAFIERRFDKARAVPAFQILSAAACVAPLVVPTRSVEVMFALHFAWAFFIAVTIPMVWAMVTDTVDYGARQGARRATGLSFAANLFAVKMGFAWGGAAVGWILGAYGYQGDAAVQTASAVFGIELSFGGLPAVASLSVAYILRAYRLDNRRMADLANDLPAGAHG